MFKSEWWGNVGLPLAIAMFIGVFIAWASSEESVEFYVTAEVLCVNENILDGRLIGMFLSGSSGYIQNDLNKVGLQYELVPGDIRLDDFKINHATLAYYKDCKQLTFNCRLRRGNLISPTIDFYLNGSEIKRIYLSKELANHVWEQHSNQ